MPALVGFLRRRGKALLLALVAPALLVAGFLVVRRHVSLRVATQSAAMNSIAVLPFANVGNDPQVERLPDGITESLIGSLSQLPDWQEMARNTVFTHKGQEVDPRRVGDDLNVRVVVTGLVRREGAHLFVSAELADAATGVRLWGEEYERPLADLPSVEREIAREISQALRSRLSGALKR
jgi:TolB-like protein